MILAISMALLVVGLIIFVIGIITDVASDFKYSDESRFNFPPLAIAGGISVALSLFVFLIAFTIHLFMI